MKTDAQVQRDVGEELKWEPQVAASQIGVQFKHSVVTLCGEVGSYAETWNTERAAQRVSGVNALAVDRKVKLTDFGDRTDADIARSTENVLSWTTSVPNDRVKVMVENGYLTLSGDVDWQHQRLAAAASVRFLSGVAGVSDQIAIKPTLKFRAAKSDTEAALKRTAIADAKNIHVMVRGADVTLTGKVRSFAAPSHALAVALLLTLPLLVRAQSMPPYPAPSASASDGRPCVPSPGPRYDVLEPGALFEPTGNADRDFANMMRAHHQEGIDMANLELANGKSSKLKAMARRIIKDQQREISELDAWTKRHDMQLSSVNPRRN